MDYFPIFAELDNRPVLVVGGGMVAERKIRLLLKARARVTVIAPHLSPALREWADAARIEWVGREFDDDDLAPFLLVFAATSSRAVNQQIFELGEVAGKLVNAVDQKDSCSFISPAIVDRSPVMIAISTGGASPVLARKLRTFLEKQLPQRLGRVADFAAVMRDKVKAAIDSLTQRRLFWEQVLDGQIYDLLIGGYEQEAQRRFEATLHQQESNATPQTPGPGLVCLVGAGPGDPGLLTIRALQAMQSADVILYDRLVSAEVLDLCRRDADLIDVGKRSGNHRLQQIEINQLLVDYALQGKLVVRLKGGDPFIFGRGGEELLALAAAGIIAEVVPGISAANACAASALLPLTHRRIARSVTFVTAHCQSSVDCIDWASLIGTDRTLAFYMGVGQIRSIQDELLRHGQSSTTPWAIIQNGTRARQRVVFGRLGVLAKTVKTEGIEAPAMLIVGEAAKIPQEILAQQQYDTSRRMSRSAVRAIA